MSLIPTGAYINNVTPWWSQDIFGTPANIAVSTLTVNPVPAGNILLQNPAPLIFQRPVGDPNAPSESLVMISSIGVPTKIVDSQYIAATKAAGTAYDDIAVQGLQVYGNQTTSGNSGAAAYITGSNGNLILAPKNSVFISSLQVSSLIAGTVVSTTTNTATSYTATLFMSTPYLNSVGISTNVIGGNIASFSTLNVSTLNAPTFAISTLNISTLSSIILDTKVSLTSTLTLLGVSSVNLGLGDVIQGLVGGAATQALGVGIGGAALVTGSVALVTGRTSGGVSSNVFQTVNGSTQLQFSTIGQAVSSVFLTTNSPNPLTTPGLEIRQSQGVAAGTYCVRSVGDPLYINNNVSSIQMFGQWVPVIQPTATVPALAISSLGVSSVNGATYPPPGGGGITSTVALSTATINGNFTQSGTGTFNWGGNTMSPTQVVLARPTSVNATLTTAGAAFLNASATVNAGLTVSGGLNVNTGNVTIQGPSQFANSLQVFGPLYGQNGIQISGATAQFNPPTVITNTLNVGLLTTLSGGLNTTTVNANASIVSPFATHSNLSVSSINGAAYPPVAVVIPSTLNASTINFNGGLTNTGTAPITTNIISTGSLFVSSVNGLPYSPGGSGIPSTLYASTVNVNGGQTITNGGLTISGGGTISDGGKWRYRLANVASAVSFEQTAGNNDSVILDLKSDKTTRFYSTLLVRDSPFPSLQPSQAAIRTYDTTDPAPYGSVITSNVSTFNIGSQYATISTISTSFVSSGTITASIIGCFNFSSLSGSINTFVTSNVTAGVAITTPTLNATNIGASNNITSPNINSSNIQSSNTIVSLNSITSPNINASSIIVSSINNQPYPLLGLTPVGAITIWAGGSETTTSQNFNPPTGWLVCDGSLIYQSIYGALYSVIGTKYGGTPPIPNTAYLPDLTFAVPMGTPKKPFANTPGVTDRVITFDALSWTSDFTSPSISTIQTWRINGVQGGTLNYGTLLNNVGAPGAVTFPKMYVSSILQFDGNPANYGYVVVRSVDNTTPIPVVPNTSTINVNYGYGVLDTPAVGTDAPYQLGTYNVNGHPIATHNQAALEVANHAHFATQQNTGTNASVTGPLSPIFGVNAPTNTLTFSNQYNNTISTVGATNIATYTAPNFLNMLYIIRY